MEKTLDPNKLDSNNGRCAVPDRSQTNRANAQQSTGPNTEEGKKRAALNALRHGLTGQIVVMPSEDLAEYKRHARAFFDEYKPQGAIEEQPVQTISDTAWRLNRVPAIEANILALGIRKHKVHIRTAEPEIRVALAAAKTFREQVQALANISIYEQRLSRQFYRAIDQLRDLQAARRTQVAQPKKRAAVVEMPKIEDLPVTTGFVCSSANPAPEIRQPAAPESFSAPPVPPDIQL